MIAPKTSRIKMQFCMNLPRNETADNFIFLQMTSSFSSNVMAITARNTKMHLRQIKYSAIQFNVYVERWDKFVIVQVGGGYGVASSRSRRISRREIRQILKLRCFTKFDMNHASTNMRCRTKYAYFAFRPPFCMLPW